MITFIDFLFHLELKALAACQWKLTTCGRRYQNPKMLTTYNKITGNTSILQINLYLDACSKIYTHCII